MKGIRICRFCLKPVELHDFSIFDDKKNMFLKEMLTKWIPELDTTLVNKPIICTVCQEIFQDYFNFIMDCQHLDTTLIFHSKISSLQRQIVPSSILNDTETADDQIKTDILKDDKMNSMNCSDTVTANIKKILDQYKKGSLEGYDPKDYKSKYVCKECTYSTKHKPELKKHWIKVHQKPEDVIKVKCEFCDSTYKNKHNLRKHMLRHKKPEEVTMFKCEQCEYSSVYEAYVKAHLTVHKAKEDLPVHHCPQCEYSTTHKGSYQEHIKLIHSNLRHEKTFTCNTCDYRSNRKRNLRTHLLIHKDPSEIRWLNCQYCEFKTKTATLLKRHMVLHVDPDELPKYNCDKCDYSSVFQRGLKRHMLTHDTLKEVQMFHCGMCDFKTKRKQNLGMHEHNIHRALEPRKMFQCETCDFKSKYQRSIKRHSLIHRKGN